MEAGTHVWPETILERPAAPERLSWKVFICLHRFWLLYLPGQSFKLLLRKKNTSSSMKWRMKYTTILCSCQPDRHISHPWFCQLWVIAHVAEWGTPPPSVAVCKKYFVTSVQFEKSCFCIFRFRFLKNDDRRKRKRERERECPPFLYASDCRAFKNSLDISVRMTFLSEDVQAYLIAVIPSKWFLLFEADLNVIQLQFGSSATNSMWLFFVCFFSPVLTM